MIVISVKAENVLKYQKLDLSNLPERGVIGISGYNESGKSSIGEVICFALFGRTYSLSADDLDKVIYWGQNHCDVTLEFKVENDHYFITRFLDKDGNHSAKLCESDSEAEPIARGVKAVSDALFEILGYEFEEFIESFYLAQREITAPHPHSLAVKIMAGVAPLEYVEAELEEEIDNKNEILFEIQTEIDTIEEEKTEMGFVEGYLIELEDSINDLEVQMVSNKNGAQALELAAERYQKNDDFIKSHRASRGRSRFFRFLMFVLALLTGGSWALFTQKPELTESVTLLGYFNQYIPQWQDSYIPYLAFVAMAAVFFMLIGWMKMSILNGKIKRLQKESAELAGAMEEVRAIQDDLEVGDEEEYSETVLDEQETVEQNDFETAEEDEEAVVEEQPIVRPADEEYEKLAPQVSQVVASVTKVQDYADREIHWLNDLLARQQQLFEDMEAEVDVEMGRLKQMAHMQESIDGLQSKADALKVRRGVREQAIKLIKAASQNLSQRFNHDVRDLVADTLPLFTQQRYEHLRIDDGLNVRVFSGEKRDFMDLEEVSSGTQRQIMLALRLALSQQLMTRMVKGKQFAFLDEPFAFFDEERTIQALNALNQLDGALSQVWIVGQSFPEATANSFAVQLDCSRDSSELVYG